MFMYLQTCPQGGCGVVDLSGSPAPRGPAVPRGQVRPVVPRVRHCPRLQDGTDVHVRPLPGEKYTLCPMNFRA